MAIKTFYKHQAHYILSYMYDKRILVTSHELKSSSLNTTQLQICTRENNEPLGQPLGPNPVVTKVTDMLVGTTTTPPCSEVGTADKT